MGTVNYMTSDYITLAVRPYDAYDVLNDPDFGAEYPAVDIDFVLDVIRDYYDADAANAETIINRRRLEYFKITIEPGYYEGLSISIKNEYLVFDNYLDRRRANREITYIKSILEELAGCGYVVCSPGWCTSYGDYNATMQAIPGAIKAMRQEVKTMPTWAQYVRAELKGAR